MKGQDCGTVKPANVIATSYTYTETDLPPSYMQRQCAECVNSRNSATFIANYRFFSFRYAKLGLMGVTVVYASGDYGVAGKDLSAGSDNSFPRMNPYF